jgi:hypothetical protein
VLQLLVQSEDELRDGQVLSGIRWRVHEETKRVEEVGGQDVD